MKKAAITLGILVLLASPSWASDIGFMASYVSVSDGDEAIGGGFRIRFGANEHVDVEVRATVYDNLEVAVPGHQFIVEMLPVEIGVAYSFRPGEQVNPYLGAGVSYFLLDSARVPREFEGEGQRGRMENELGYYIVGGVEIPVRDNMTIFGEVIFRQLSGTIEGDDLAFSIVSEQFDLGGAALNLGASFSW